MKLPCLAAAAAIALAACQAPAPTTAALPDAPSPEAADLASLRLELEELRALCVAALVQPPPAAAPVLAAAAPAGAALPVSAAVDAPADVDTLVQSLAFLQEQRLVHCENLANQHTPGYKRRSLQPRPAGGSLLRLEVTQGTLELTGNQLDLAIEGPGFFEVALPDGELRYTRNGTFRQDINGLLVTPEGYSLTERILIPADAQGIALSQEGEAFALVDENTLVPVGSLRVHTFRNPEGLQHRGDDHFAATAASGPAQPCQPGTQGAGTIRQGYLERSNVELLRESVAIQRINRQAAAINAALTSYGIQTP